jgi:hypothetical protein
VSLNDELTKDAKLAHKKQLATAENSASGGAGRDDEYAVPDDEAAWQAVLSKSKGGNVPLSVSIPKKRQSLLADTGAAKREDDEDQGGSSNKKKKFKGGGGGGGGGGGPGGAGNKGGGKHRQSSKF